MIHDDGTLFYINFGGYILGKNNNNIRIIIITIQ